MPELPLTLQLDAGTYWLCTCGKSENFPYCNGAHKGSGFTPKQFELTAPATVEITAPGEAIVR
ncbi:CDGSH iron-sulfur domain-containing protein [Leptolyngbya sp. FACHB-711]|jgi:CDGSH-type Zn-finger protein|uniref:CDGSH iron-sulfur domain-containing protein n=1 Tax=unclassified Leptolyngbya TaxID=2650499 RepID=UPI001682EC94|nr:CDGSH iron-sulfur domain-containing protein [Leptolyngbya sp. FACHB-711]MBD1851560.1 CDGSH iron-sulfur domain-containing protein [Cyanobacteria bacterium FACHB-502]MBD2026706.1 CDGSH iron-sulfur domain-containing protein [Leptolyngbya sp. FACHB-711]